MEREERDGADGALSVLLDGLLLRSWEGVVSEECRAVETEELTS